MRAVRRPLGPLRYLSPKDGPAIFEQNGRPIFSIEPVSRRLQLVAHPGELAGPLVLYLQAIIPKLLAFLEIPVLHAAACSVGENLLAFSGISGAGKTTTARAFERSGAILRSEDLVILSFAGDSPLMYLHGERFARDWAREAATRLEKRPDRELDFYELTGTPNGPTVPVTDIWFVEVTRRAGVDLKLRTLELASGVLTLLRTGMLASSQADHWRDFLRRSRFLADKVALSRSDHAGWNRQPEGGSGSLYGEVSVVEVAASCHCPARHALLGPPCLTNPK